MPPRWPRQPDRNDPAYRKLDDRMNFALHVAIFAATNSGVWFFRLFQHPDWEWTIWFTAVWVAAIIAHGLYIFALADYSNPAESGKLPNKST